MTLTLVRCEFTCRGLALLNFIANENQRICKHKRKKKGIGTIKLEVYGWKRERRRTLSEGAKEKLSVQPSVIFLFLVHVFTRAPWCRRCSCWCDFTPNCRRLIIHFSRQTEYSCSCATASPVREKWRRFKTTRSHSNGPDRTRSSSCPPFRFVRAFVSFHITQHKRGKMWAHKLLTNPATLPWDEEWTRSELILRENTLKAYRRDKSVLFKI